jgi:hypothetical protein
MLRCARLRVDAVLHPAVTGAAVVTVPLLTQGTPATAAPCPSRSAQHWCNPRCRRTPVLGCPSVRWVTKGRGDHSRRRQRHGSAPHTEAQHTPLRGWDCVRCASVTAPSGNTTAMQIPMALAATWPVGLAEAHDNEIGKRGAAHGQRRGVRPDPQHRAYAESRAITLKNGAGCRS